MLVLNLTAGTTAASTPITFTTALNTNNDFIVGTNNIQIVQPGIYEIIGSASLESTATGNYTIGIYQGTTSLSETTASATAIGDIASVTLYDVINVIVATNSYVTLQFLTTEAPTIVSGTIGIKKIV